MKELFDKLIVLLQKEDKENALNLCINALKEKSVSVVELYESILAPALNNIIKEYEDDKDLIWREHVRSGIVRNIIECAYPYVLEERHRCGYKKDKGNVIVICPQYEEHELGARMVSDFFLIAGYNSTFIGANTPQKTILKAVEIIVPKYLCISVTNYFNLVFVKEVIKNIRKSFDYEITFLLGGSAFLSNPGIYKELGGDLLLNSFNDIKNLDKGVEKD